MQGDGTCPACCGAQRLVFCLTCGGEQLTNENGRCIRCLSDPAKPGFYLPYEPPSETTSEPEE